MEVEGVRGNGKVVCANILISQYGGREILSIFYETKGGSLSRVIEGSRVNWEMYDASIIL